MQMLYEWDISGNTPDQVRATFFLDKRAEPDVEKFARELFEGTVNHGQELDRLVREGAEHWRLERLAAVDRNILRVALYELLHHPETPPAAVINEARQAFPARQSVANGGCQFAFLADQAEFCVQPWLQRINQGTAFLLSNCSALLGASPADVLFDGVQRGNTFKRFAGDRSWA